MNELLAKGCLLLIWLLLSVLGGCAPKQYSAKQLSEPKFHPRKEFRVEITDGLYMDYSWHGTTSYRVVIPDSSRYLGPLVQFIKGHPQYYIVIDAQHSQLRELSNREALADATVLKRYLESHNIPAQKITATSTWDRQGTYVGNGYQHRFVIHFIPEPTEVKHFR